MTGPEHLRQAELLLSELGTCRATGIPCRFCHDRMMQALVHVLTALILTIAALGAGTQVTR